MVPAQKLPPIVIVGPSRDVDFLRDELIRAGVEHPLLRFSSTDDARDFLDAALVAMSLDDRFVPCLTLLDAAVPEKDQARFVEWTRRQADLQGMHVTLIETDEAGPGSPLIRERVQLKAGTKKWRDVVSKSCR